MSEAGVTRGYGLLEGFLAKQRRKMARRLLASLASRDRILDIGCSEFPHFLMETDFREKFGLDKVATAGSVQGTSGPAIAVMNHDIERDYRLPFDENFFDAVTMLAVFEHIEPRDLRPLITDIQRVLKPGGIYILTTPAFWTDKLLRTLAKLHLVSPVEIEEHKDAYSTSRIAAILEESNFSSSGIRLGYFELGMNIWGCARKEGGR
jgi:SAM-dependent methyltransferase